MNDTTKKEPAVRRYVVKDANNIERLVKAASPATAVQQVYETKVRVASGDDIERLLTQALES